MDSRTCPACGRDYIGHCETCWPLYAEDIRTGHIPPQFIKAGVEMSFMDWAMIKEAELHALATAEYAEKYPTEFNQGKAELARQEVNSTICNLVSVAMNRRPAVRQANEAKRKQSFIDRLRKSSTY